VTTDFMSYGRYGGPKTALAPCPCYVFGKLCGVLVWRRLTVKGRPTGLTREADGTPHTCGILTREDVQA
jgi:hypothetical protein